MATRVNLGTLGLDVLVADTPEKWARGVIGQSLDGLDGMLFVIPPDAHVTAFHMRGVPHPLVVAFFDAEGALVDFQYLEPETGIARTPVFFHYALELVGRHTTVDGALTVLAEAATGLRTQP